MSDAIFSPAQFRVERIVFEFVQHRISQVSLCYQEGGFAGRSKSSGCAIIRSNEGFESYVNWLGQVGRRLREALYTFPQQIEYPLIMGRQQFHDAMRAQGWGQLRQGCEFRQERLACP